MRVLWFCNTPSLAKTFSDSSNFGAGWIEAVEEIFYKKKVNIDLGICFNVNKVLDDTSEFKITNEYNTVYYPVFVKKGRISRLLNNHLHRIDSSIDHYLKVVDDFKPDLIHFFGAESIFASIIPYLSVPHILHIQGILNPILHKWHSSGMNQWDIIFHSSIKSNLIGNGIFHNFYKFKKQAKRELLIYKNCNNFMGRTDWDKRVSRFLSPDSNYYHCDEVLRDEFYNFEWNYNPNKGKYIIATTINSGIYKGLETIIFTSRLLKDAKFDFEWNIYGLKEESEMVRLFEGHFKCKFNDYNIRFNGPVSPLLLVKCLLKSHVFVHASHIDNSPNSVCEAMILGMPVISTRVGGVSSLINDKIDGYLVQEGEPFDMASCIFDIYKQPDKAAQVGKNARSAALKRHNRDTILSAIIEAYHEVIRIKI